MSEVRWNETRIDEANMHRDSLSLKEINRNGTVEEMIETINANFRNIAEHGGGPAGFDGTNGIDGVDGVNAEFIYALCDSITSSDAGTKYPADIPGMEDLFERVNATQIKASFNNVEWYNHPQGISPEHKNEYVIARYRRNEGTEWAYSQPALWAHWGETGKDGDGVEYIFITVDHEMTPDEASSLLLKKSQMTDAQKVIFNMDDFYPGSGWFNSTNRDKAYTALINAGIPGIDQSTFSTKWTAKFDMCLEGADWTDDPAGTNSDKPFEYVSIRRCNTDEATGEKEWNDFSIPALWSNYNYTSRTFIIYKNTTEKDEEGNPVRPPKPEGGFWDVENDRLLTNKPGYQLTTGWSDKDIEEDGKYTWISSGIFNHNGKLSKNGWSNPICITGADGLKGEDGSGVEFIYALADRMVSGVHYPSTTDKTELGEFFDLVEQQKEYVYGGVMTWYDRAQPITPSQRTEYVWIRQKNTANDEWEYLPAPIVWAHWGEDGTDGDGVEYIFYASMTDSCPTPIRLNQMTGELGHYEKAIFNISDFYPGIGWFSKNTNYQKAVEVIQDAQLSEAFLQNHWDEIKTAMSQEWTDNPRGVNAITPYEYVSIRRSSTDGEVKKVWGDFSDPVLWSYYGKKTRLFMVYCNVDETDGTPIMPTGGFWNTTTDKLQKSSNDTSDFICPALSTGTYTPGTHIGYWADDDVDVRGKICWTSTGTFVEDNSSVIWSTPHRLTGARGQKGEDGTDIEFIYALDNNPVYPTTDEGKAALFEAVENATMDAQGLKSYTYADPNDPDLVTIWYDNAKPIDKVNKIEYCWSRRRNTETNEWIYTSAPFIWAHWGEDGTDGDGVEYIFHISQVNTLDPSSPERPVVATTPEQKILFQMDDFYPGDNWFRDNQNKTDAKRLLQEAGIYNAETFEENWTNHFGFNSGTANSWTDNPTDVSSTQPFEFVAIRKTYTDTDGSKKWGDFSEPAVWASYGKSTRTFVVYCNVVGEGEITAPPQGTGWYNSSGFGSLQMSDVDSSPFKYDILDINTRQAVIAQGYDDTNIGYWSDTDEDVENTITWIATGTFSESGDNLAWSEPHRITGDKGQRGADGSNIEFIYAREDTMELGVNYPQSGVNYNTWRRLFDLVENPDLINDPEYTGLGFVVEEVDGVKCVNYNGTRWFDRAQLISEEHRIVWAWSRRLPAGGEMWKYDNAPFVWAHWGEDGTDGDGIEYIFMLTQDVISITESDWNNKFTNKPTSDTAKAIYDTDDFIPNSNWFTSAHKTKVQNTMSANNKTFVESDWNSTQTYFSFNNIGFGIWKDNPQKLDTSDQYQYVSVRKSSDGEWGDFSYPVLWSKYNISKFTAFA